MLLERLHKLSMQHEAEVAAKAGSSASLNTENGINHQASSFASRTSPDFSSVSSEGPEHDGGEFTLANIRRFPFVLYSSEIRRRLTRSW